MRVFVIGQTGKRLMPTTARKARLLLRDGKAVVYKKNPFTIKLIYKTGGSTSTLRLGVDTGSQHVGIGIIENNKVLYKAEITLRDSMEKRSLMETRKEYRRGRRYRKVRYRHPKWKQKTLRRYSEKPDRKGRHWHKIVSCYESDRTDGWLPPSIESKVNHQIRIIKNYMDVLPKDTILNIEVGRFDMARMQDPTVHNELYQKGPQYDYENVKAYVLDRDRYKCKCCQGKGGTHRKDGTTIKLIVHHILFRSKAATDNPTYLATVCDKCHTTQAHKPGGKLYDWMIKEKSFGRGLRDATFMNILRKRMFSEFSEANFTYGNITAADRKIMMHQKSHSNDAIAIALCKTDITVINDAEQVVYIRQVRAKKRSLHEATPRKGRTVPNREAKRNSKNTKSVNDWKLWDKVNTADRKTGYISGFSGTSAYIQAFSGEYIQPEGKNYKQHILSGLRRLSHNNNWLITSA